MSPPRRFKSVNFEDLHPGLSSEHLHGVPPGYDDDFGDWSILWLVLDLDKKYAILTPRRNVLQRLVEVVRNQGVHEVVGDDVTTFLQDLSTGQPAAFDFAVDLHAKNTDTDTLVLFIDVSDRIVVTF